MQCDVCDLCDISPISLGLVKSSRHINKFCKAQFLTRSVQSTKNCSSNYLMSFSSSILSAL